jgi:hypothetical protein
MKTIEELCREAEDAWSWYEATGDARDVAAIASLTVEMAERIDALLAALKGTNEKS